jgi:hypothetical protein
MNLNAKIPPGKCPRTTPHNSARKGVLGNNAKWHTSMRAPELVRAFIGKYGTVRGQIKSPLMEKCFRPSPNKSNTYTEDALLL